ncbi:dephospho-CoA kinase [Corynebacterium sp. ZY180755]
MKRIGLTGGIGSGKSTVAAILAEHGFPIIDADKIAREVVEPGQPALAELALTFGEDILNEDGSLNRQALANVAFVNEENRQALNNITHPRINARTEELFAEAESAGKEAAVWDMPLLVDQGYQDRVDIVIVVDVDAETRLKRLVESRGLDEADARRRIASQIDDETRRKAADFIVDNNGERAALEPQVKEIIKNLRGM